MRWARVALRPYGADSNPDHPPREREIEPPSVLLLSGRRQRASGAAFMAGTRLRTVKAGLPAILLLRASRRSQEPAFEVVFEDIGDALHGGVQVAALFAGGDHLQREAQQDTERLHALA